MYSCHECDVYHGSRLDVTKQRRSTIQRHFREFDDDVNRLAFLCACAGSPLSPLSAFAALISPSLGSFSRGDEAPSHTRLALSQHSSALLAALAALAALTSHKQHHHRHHLSLSLLTRENIIDSVLLLLKHNTFIIIILFASTPRRRAVCCVESRA